MKVISKSIYVLMVIDAFIFAFSAVFIANHHNIPDKFIILTAILFTLCGIYVLFMKEFYKIEKYELSLKDAYLLLEGIVLAAVIPFVSLMLFDFSGIAFKFFLENILLVYVLIFICRKLFYYHRKYLKQSSNVLIIGAGDAGKIMAKEILARPMLKLNIVGFVDNDEDGSQFDYEGIKILGEISDLKKIIEENDVKTIIVAIATAMDYCILMDISKCVPQGVATWKMVNFYEKITQKIPVSAITSDWFMYEFTSNKRPLYEFIKRIFDIISAVIILLVTFPVLVLIGIVVKLHNCGPVMYFQNRVGRDGKVFKMYKLRTMYEGAEKEGMVDKGNIEDDRVIPFCKWVRKARFDEIPQMINVLKGEMSITGPRAEFEDFARKYEKEIPFYNRRHWITPGWTGWAQINQGHCVEVGDIIEKLRYDFFYIKNRNIFWDLNILLKAVSLALTGRHG